MFSKFMKYILSGILVFLILNTNAIAQASEIEMADQMRANGKIYVVLLTVLIVLSGLFLFLIYLDKKISELEK